MVEKPPLCIPLPSVLTRIPQARFPSTRTSSGRPAQTRHDTPPTREIPTRSQGPLPGVRGQGSRRSCRKRPQSQESSSVRVKADTTAWRRGRQAPLCVRSLGRIVTPCRQCLVRNGCIRAQSIYSAGQDVQRIVDVRSRRVFAYAEAQRAGCHFLRISQCEQNV